MADPFIGEIRTLGFNWAPIYWAKCDGQVLPISQNSALYSLLGFNFGGDGRTTFGIPDLRSRVPMHYGTGNGLTYRPFSIPGGAEASVLNPSNLPAALPITATTTISGEVDLKVSNEPGNSAFAPGNGLGKLARDVETNAGIEMYASNPTFNNTDEIAGVTHNLTAQTVVTGGLSGGSSSPFNNMQPYLALNFCIALNGLYPSRS